MGQRNQAEHLAIGLKQGVPTHAAMLLFGRNDPPHALHIGRFKTPSTIIDDRMIRGTLFDVVEDAMKFIYEESGDGYIARLEYIKQRTETQPKIAPKVGEKVGEKLTDNQRNILECMRKDAFVSAGQIAETIGISLRKTEENIQKLRAKGLIERIGPARGGHWDVLR